MQDVEKRIDMLAKRVELLEKDNARGYNTFIATKERITPSLSHEISFAFIATKDAYLKFAITVDCDCEICSIEVKIDGAKVYTCNTLAGKAEFVAPVSKGDKRLSVMLETDELSVVNSITAEIGGCVLYPKEECVLTVINDQSRSTVCYLFDGELLVKRYIDGLFETVVQKLNVKCGTICKVENQFALFFVTADGVLKLEYLSYEDYTVLSQGVIDQDVSSVCAISGNTAILFSVKGNRIYRYEVDSNYNCSSQITGYTARRVSSDPSIPGYIIATDFAGNGKIINIG